MISRYAGLTKEFGWKYGSDSQNVFVREVDPEGAAAGKLQVGDRILSINDETLVSRVAPLYVLRTIAVESDYTIRVQRSGDEVILKLSLPPLAHDSSYLGPLLSRLLVSAVFLILAMLIGLVRPGERIAQLACIGSISGAMIEVESALKPMVAFFHGPENVIYALLSAIFTTMSWAIAYHFFYRFPPGVPKGRLWLFLKWLFYSWAAVICIILVSQRLGYLINNRTMIAILFRPDLYLKVIPAFSSPFFILLPFALVGIIVRNYRLIKEPDQRRRMKWVIYGSIAATAPTIVNAIIFFLLVTFGQRGVTQSYFQLGDWSRRLDLISDLAFVIVPITFSYAIIKHRVFDINVVVRRGLQYVLARNVLQVILALPLIGLGYQLISNPNQTVADIVFRNPMYLLLAAAAAISLKYRRRVTGWIDRKFFREAYNQEQILIGLMDEIKELDSMADISRLVSGKLDSALHLPRIYVFYRGADTLDLSLGYSSGGASPALTIPGGAHLLDFMERQQSAQEYPFPQRRILPPDEQAWLDRLEINLIVPMNGTDGRLVGLLLLGEKKSEQPYTADDLRLLEAIAQQIAVVYEIILLKQHVDKEAKIKREVLTRLEEKQINLVKECPGCGACYDSTEQFCTTDGRELLLALPLERTIDSKYRLEQMLGKGGMGAVYRATDLRLGRQVAIKVITGNLFGDQTLLRRFEREARASARLNHPNIAGIHDFGRTAGDGAYLVMELIDGVTLRQELRRVGHLPARFAADLFSQLLEGVKAAHAAGIIHRDLKPENVLIAQGESAGKVIKIVDFGLAKLRLVDASDPNTLTTPGIVMGTISYMSPERLTGEEVDERSDIFSLGVILVEPLTGSRPFTGKTYNEFLTSILHKSYHLKDSNKESERLDKVVQKCIAKDPEQRYATVAEMQKELIPALEIYSRFEGVVHAENQQAC